MHPNQELLQIFYTSFQRRDPDAMTACYLPNVVFYDPVFQALRGKRAIAMWHMLIERSKDLEIIIGEIHADDLSGSAHWEAKYTYSATGRKVHNVVDGHFYFQEGKIFVHQDAFDIWKWATQALGMSGRLFGWTPFMQRAIRRTAARTLDAYIAR